MTRITGPGEPAKPVPISGMAPPRRLGFRGFLRALVGERPGRFAWVIAVQIGAGLGQGLGVLILVPLLGAVGVRASSGLSGWVRDGFNAVGLKPTLAAILVLYVAVTVATAALSAYQSVLSTRYYLEFVDHLRGRLYGAIAHAEWRHLMGLRQSDVLAALSTNITCVATAVLGTLTASATMLMVCAQLAAAIRISLPLSALALASGTLLLVVVWPLVSRSRRLGYELVERNRGVVGLATGFLDGLKLAKAYGKGDDHLSAFNDAVTSARSSEVGFARAAGMATAAQASLTALLLAATVWVAVGHLRVPISSLLVVAFVFIRVASQVTFSQSNIQQVAQGLPAFDEVMELIAGCEAAAEASFVHPQGTRRIRIGEGVSLDRVHFSYPNGTGPPVKALHGVSLEIPAGTMVALAGPSGAGKTTLADLVGGLITPTDGEVSVGGQPLTPERIVSWRESVALVPQDPFLFHDTVRANLEWACPGAGEAQLWEALEMAAAGDLVRRLPLALDAVVGDRGMRLSGGERQRLALARALLRRPDLLILDEATSALDAENDLAIRTALAALHGRTTVLVIAHRFAAAAEADQVVVLEAGQVVECGSWSELSRLGVGRLRSLIEAGATNAGVDSMSRTSSSTGG